LPVINAMRPDTSVSY